MQTVQVKNKTITGSKARTKNEDEADIYIGVE